MKNILFKLIIISSVIQSYSFAQEVQVESNSIMKNTPWFVKEMMKDIIEEKTHLSLEEIRNIYFNNEIKSSLSKSKNEDIYNSYPNLAKIVENNDEVGVSTSSGVESELHVAINPKDTNNIVVSAIYQSETNNLYCTIYFTKDFGKTWIKSAFKTTPKVLGVTTIGGGDPFFAFDKDGKCYLSWINLYLKGNKSTDSGYFSLVWASSTDGGENWVRPTNDVIGVGAMLSSYIQLGFLTKGFDKQWMSVDKTDSPYRGNLYCVFYEINVNSNPQAVINFRKKLANSNSFQNVSIPISGENFTQVQFSQCEVSPNGNVHVTFMGKSIDDTNDLALWHCSSSNGGDSFDEPQKVTSFRMPRFATGFLTSDTILGVSAKRQYPCPQLSIDYSNTSSRGNLYMCWTGYGITKKEKNGADIYFTSSKDNGYSWSNPIIINDDKKGIVKHNFYPSMTVNPNGVIVINWYDKRLDSLNKQTSYYSAMSFDNGKTFSTNIPISNLSSDFSKIGLKNNSFGIGEYNNTVSTIGYAIPVWADGRKNNGDIDLYMAHVLIGNRTTSIETITSLNNGLYFTLSPIPALDLATISFDLKFNQNIQLEVYNSSGIKVDNIPMIECKVGKNLIKLNVEKYLNGTYFCKLSSNSGSFIRKFTVINN